MRYSPVFCSVSLTVRVSSMAYGSDCSILPTTESRLSPFMFSQLTRRRSIKPSHMAYQKVAQRCNDASDPSRFASRQSLGAVHYYT